MKKVTVSWSFKAGDLRVPAGKPYGFVRVTSAEGVVRDAFIPPRMLARLREMALNGATPRHCSVEETERGYAVTGWFVDPVVEVRADEQDIARFEALAREGRLEGVLRTFGDDSKCFRVLPVEVQRKLHELNRVAGLAQRYASPRERIIARRRGIAAEHARMLRQHGFDVARLLEAQEGEDWELLGDVKERAERLLDDIRKAHNVPAEVTVDILGIILESNSDEVDWDDVRKIAEYHLRSTLSRKLNGLAGTCGIRYPFHIAFGSEDDWGEFDITLEGPKLSNHKEGLPAIERVRWRYGEEFPACEVENAQKILDVYSIALKRSEDGTLPVKAWTERAVAGWGWGEEDMYFSSTYVRVWADWVKDAAAMVRDGADPEAAVEAAAQKACCHNDKKGE